MYIKERRRKLKDKRTKQKEMVRDRSTERKTEKQTQTQKTAGK